MLIITLLYNILKTNNNQNLKTMGEHIQNDTILKRKITNRQVIFLTSMIHLVLPILVEKDFLKHKAKITSSNSHLYTTRYRQIKEEIKQLLKKYQLPSSKSKPMVTRKLESNRKAKPQKESKKYIFQVKQEKAANKKQLHNLENELLELAPKLSSKQWAQLAPEHHAIYAFLLKKRNLSWNLYLYSYYNILLTNLTHLSTPS